ncbi:MAG: Ribosome-recycling factor [Alphaproteobacteria bacterium MarineAlpha8_Bin1]|nr:MAG: Ribosome-recycling factor [Alphaproteobacteria bacterium MarineAlpha8_Bin1]|tara:strand:- start:1046 stop:1600 length:555 start_codon:yes stop_codon:yes gene_type:complete
MNFELNIYEEKMSKALEVLKREFSGLRTGRASVSLLDPIIVEAYGSKVPLTQVSNISVPEARLITVQVWDESQIASVENAIRNSDLGLNPMSEGNVIRIPIPELSEERRIEIVKIASKYSEDSKVVIRNIRRDAMEKIKTSEKNKEISKDESFQFSEDVQKITNKFIGLIDTLFEEKEKDILKV